MRTEARHTQMRDRASGVHRMFSSISPQKKPESAYCQFYAVFLFENGESFLRTTYTQQPCRLLVGHTVFQVCATPITGKREHLFRSAVFKTCFQFPDPFSVFKTLKRFWISIFVFYISVFIVLKIKN